MEKGLTAPLFLPRQQAMNFSHPTLLAQLVIAHTGDVTDVETVRLSTDDDGHLELCDSPYLCHEREPDSEITILRRLKMGQLSGTHVFPQGTGFAHWHIELRGDVPAFDP